MDALFFDLGLRDIEGLPVSRLLYWFERAVERRKRGGK